MKLQTERGIYRQGYAEIAPPAGVEPTTYRLGGGRPKPHNALIFNENKARPICNQSTTDALYVPVSAGMRSGLQTPKQFNGEAPRG